MKIDKNQIRQRFQKAASTYDKQAVIQLKVAERLLWLLENAQCREPNNILEIGSCTGLLTQEILKRYTSIDTILVNDIVAEFQDNVYEKIKGKTRSFTFIPGDIEYIKLPESLDLVISSSTFHWLHNLNSFLKKLRCHIRPGGYLAFAMYGPKNLQEIKKVTGIGLNYPDIDKLKKMVSESYEVISCEENTEIFSFENPLMLLKHLRETGVNSLKKSSWTKKSLAEFTKNYQKHYSNKDGVSLTYHPMYCVARRLADQ